MRTRVTAILVAQQGGEWLDQTIAGLASQTLAPDAIIAVNNGGAERVSQQLMESGATRVIGVASKLPFGRAVAEGIAMAAPAAAKAEADTGTDTGADAGPDDAGADDAGRCEDWIWLLSEDSCPEPEALERIVSRVQRAPSVVVAGPKLVDWDRPERIIELGQSLTRFGTRWTLRRQELDQQQYDHLQDVLGVGPVGMLVRRDIWQQLGGFDPALRVYDDALDFCVRVRLAGYRVEVSPESRVRFAQSGVAGPRIDRKRSVMRAAHRRARTAHLHRRIAYAPPLVTFFLWLGLPLYALVRVLWALIREQPGHIPGEVASAAVVFFTPHAIIASRRRIKRNSTAGWGAIRPLRTDPKTVRTARMIDREAILASTGRQRRELHFISSGGLGVLVTSAVVAVVLTWWALSHTSLVGGALAPLNSIGDLWRNTRSIDGVPADPFTWVLALLGSLTFWNPSLSIVIVVVASVPLAALGAWVWAAGITESRTARVLLSLGFALSPVLLVSIAGGRLNTLVLASVLPWLLLAASRCRESWSWAATASLLAAAALAAAPVLIPAAIVLLIVGLFTTVRGLGRVLTVALVPLVLFAPKIIWSLWNGRPFDLLLDPGVVSPFEPGNEWHMLLGYPEFGMSGWGDVVSSIGIAGPSVSLLVGLLLTPLALLAIVGLFAGRLGAALLCALLGGLGMLTAIGSTHLHLAVSGDTSVAVWTGSGLVVYWAALLTLATLGASVLRRAAGAVAAVALVGALVAVIPAGSHLALGRAEFTAAEQQMPALVQAAGESDPHLRTLVLHPRGENEVHARMVVGAGPRLDGIRTAAQAPNETAEDREIADLVAALSSVGGADVRAPLAAAHVGFVLLADASDSRQRADLQRVFDQNGALASAGVTEQGLLWRVVQSDEATGDDGDVSAVLPGTKFSGQAIWTTQLVLVLAVLLLALPTGEVTWRPERRRKPARTTKGAE